VPGLTFEQFVAGTNIPVFLTIISPGIVWLLVIAICAIDLRMGEPLRKRLAARRERRRDQRIARFVRENPIRW
jgi:hypothetical protein